MNLQDVIEKLRAKDPDFGKVNNSNPQEEFAFNIPGLPSVAEVGRLTRKEAVQQLTAIDDFGSPITHVPVGLTTSSVFFDFCPHSLILETNEASLPVGAFVWEIADAIVREMCPYAADFNFVCPVEEILGSRFERFYYSPSPTSDWWHMTFDDDTSLEPSR
jgi:hypothetical protein